MNKTEVISLIFHPHVYLDVWRILNRENFTDAKSLREVLLFFDVHPEGGRITDGSQISKTSVN